MNVLFNTEHFVHAPTGSSNFTSVTKGLSETNKMPGHGRNVHVDALKSHCDYHSFEETLDKVTSTRFTHSPYARTVTMRFRNLAFERLPTVATDIQCILFALIGPEPVVRSVAPKAPGASFIEAEVLCANPERVQKVMNERVIVIDRHGFHVARGTVTIESMPSRRGGRNAVNKEIVTPNSDEASAVLDHCKNVRQLPQKERHFVTDGLPCVPTRVELIC